MDTNDTITEWDVFISYASEDRAEVAGPLANTLSDLGLQVWFDQSELTLGDSLRRKIDEGLNRCRFGVVILSPDFFMKHYPNKELDGLAQRELKGRKVILPVWHRVTDEQVREYSPSLADRIAVPWEDGVLTVAAKIYEVIHPEVVEELKRATHSIKTLAELRTGGELFAVLSGALAFNFANEDLTAEPEVDLVGGFLQQLRDCVDIVSELDVEDRLRAEFRIKVSMEELMEAGWRIFGRQEMKRFKFGKSTETWPVAVIVIAREGAREVVRLAGGRFGILRPPKGGYAAANKLLHRTHQSFSQFQLFWQSAFAVIVGSITNAGEHCR